MCGRPHLPSQVTSTRISPCADFRWRFFELSLSVIVRVSRRQLTVEEATAPVFFRVAVRGRERCFLIFLRQRHRAEVQRQSLPSVPLRNLEKIAPFCPYEGREVALARRKARRATYFATESVKTPNSRNMERVYRNDGDPQRLTPEY